MEQSKEKVIFWVDDDRDDIEMFEQVLREIAPEYKVFGFENGRLLLNQLFSAGAPIPALIILDINMPVMDGKETLLHLKKHEGFAAIPVVVLTTSESKLDKAFCEKMKTEMLVKPFTELGLRNVLRRALSHIRL